MGIRACLFPLLACDLAPGRGSAAEVARRLSLRSPADGIAARVSPRPIIGQRRSEAGLGMGHAQSDTSQAYMPTSACSSGHGGFRCSVATEECREGMTTTDHASRDEMRAPERCADDADVATAAPERE